MQITRLLLDMGIMEAVQAVAGPSRRALDILIESTFRANIDPDHWAGALATILDLTTARS